MGMNDDEKPMLEIQFEICMDEAPMPLAEKTL